MLREEGVAPVLRWLMWAGVRWSAITQAHRRPGWWSTAGPLLGVSVAGLPVVAPAAVAILAGLGVYTVAERLATGGRRGGHLST